MVSAGAVEIVEDRCRPGVVSCIVGQVEGTVRGDGAEAGVLEGVGTQFVLKSDAATLMPAQIDENTVAGSAIAASEAESWSPQSQRCDPRASPVRHSLWTRTRGASTNAGSPIDITAWAVPSWAKVRSVKSPWTVGSLLGGPPTRPVESVLPCKAVIVQVYVRAGSAFRQAFPNVPISGTVMGPMEPAAYQREGVGLRGFGVLLEPQDVVAQGR